MRETVHAASRGVRLGMMIALLGAGLGGPAAAQDLSGAAAVAASQGNMAAPGLGDPSSVTAPTAYGLVGGVSDYGPGAAAREAAIAARPDHPPHHARQARRHIRERHLARLTW